MERNPMTMHTPSYKGKYTINQPVSYSQPHHHFTNSTDSFIAQHTCQSKCRWWFLNVFEQLQYVSTITIGRQERVKDGWGVTVFFKPKQINAPDLCFLHVIGHKHIYHFQQVHFFCDHMSSCFAQICPTRFPDWTLDKAKCTHMTGSLPVHTVISDPSRAQQWLTMMPLFK